MIEQPVLGQQLERIRSTASAGKRMSRVAFGELIGVTPTQVRNIEQGRTLRPGEYERIVAAFPQLASGRAGCTCEPHDHWRQVDGIGYECTECGGWAQFKIVPRSITVQVFDAEPAAVSALAGQRCIQCGAGYTASGSIKHKNGCPELLPRPPSTISQESAQLYCRCGAHAGWREAVPDSGLWVCANCGKPSRLVWERQSVFEVGSAGYGDLVALNDELEDPESGSESGETIEPQPATGLLTDLARRLDLTPGIVSGEVGADAANHWTALVSGADPSFTHRCAPPLSVISFSNSEIQTFKRCRRKWYLAWYRELQPRQRSITGALATGTRAHESLRAWYVPEDQTPTDPRIAHNRVVERDWRSYLQACEERREQPMPEVVRAFNESIALERAMLDGYLNWLAETGVDEGLRVIAAETYLEAPLDVPGSGVSVKLIGKLDVRVQREIDGARLIIDHKTVGSLTEPLKTIRLNEQMMHYLLLEWLSGVDEGRCDGALYNMLRKVKGTSRAKPPFFDRVEVRHNVHELESFKKRIIGVIRTILDVRQRLDNGEDPAVVVYPSPSDRCAWDCEFLAVCPMHDDGSRVEHMIEQCYEVGDKYSYYRDDKEE